MIPILLLCLWLASLIINAWKNRIGNKKDDGWTTQFCHEANQLLKQAEG